jgi:phosphatidylserine/phosphatidylglycerophosphate/cardiolipin synthase-like enzyme
MKVKFYFLVIILVVFSIFLLSSCNPLVNNNYTDNDNFESLTGNSTILVYFTNPPNDAGLADRLVDFMDTAKATIDMAIYGLDEKDDQIVNELIKKKDEGVKVRIVTDTDSLEKYNDDFDKLKNEGVTIVSDNMDHIMHDKFVVVDNNKVWTGSTNFTDNGFDSNYNNSITIFATAVALLYDKEFNQMFVDKKFEYNKAPLYGEFNINGTKLEVYFGPKEKIMNQVLDEVKTANYSIDFDIFTFTYKSLADSLINKKSMIKGVFDSWQSESSYSQYNYLKDNGVDVKKDGLKDSYGGGLLHNKVMIIDEGTDSDPVVITGSANWTNSVENYNDENMIIIHSKKISKLYYNNFLTIYNKGVN